MDDKDKEHLDRWLDEEIVPKIEHIESSLKEKMDEEKAERLLPAILQLSATPQYYFEKEIDRRRNELLARLKSRLKTDEGRRKFTEFIHEEDIPYKTGAKSTAVAQMLNNELLKEALDHLEE